MPPTVPVDPLSGHVGHLSIIQQHTLDKFRKELQEQGVLVPERHDDATLLRFLRARKFDLPRAKEMIIAQEQWRKDFKIEELGLGKNFDFPEKAEVNKYYPQYYHKTDKDGRPIYVEQLGKLDINALYAVTTEERLLQRLVHEYEKFLTERLPACSAQVGHEVETSCTIMDLKNVGLSSFYRVKDYVSKASKIGQDYYPECMGKFYIINAPYLFSTVWAFIKPWLDEVTVAKINILGSNYKAELLKQVPAENLPVEFGGTCQCEGGCSMSDAGPWNKPTQ
ncbi:cytosolic factor, phosphatidylinositol/phosphatidylcholine transfer protein [Tulasnella sp. 418]|nr:cytosolic factor, phosphatidylinositol/phosphatidylcholine transfer protein [Tulasnella sp. 418]